MIDFVRISLVVLGTTLGISIIVIIAMEAGVRELLKITEQYKFMKITYLLLAVKRTAYAMIFTIFSTIVVILLTILFEKNHFGLTILCSYKLSLFL